MLELRTTIQTGRVTCRNCGAPVPQSFWLGPRNRDKILQCGQCGWKATCGEYYESYTGGSMRPGSAYDLFEDYMARFARAKTAQEKMLLIDWLIHLFHVMQGVARMPMGVNVILGSTDQVRELIESLAGSPSSTPGLASVDQWRAVYYDPVRLFKQSHSHSQVQQIAAQLGIKGRSQMSEDELIPEILRLAPELVEEGRKKEKL